MKGRKQSSPCSFSDFFNTLGATCSDFPIFLTRCIDVDNLLFGVTQSDVCGFVISITRGIHDGRISNE